MKIACAAFLCLLATTSAARADMVAATTLQKDYTNCMAGETAQQDPPRNQYCLCVRDTMKGWSKEAYGQLAEAESKAHDAADLPQELKDIAKACMAKIAH